MFGCLQLTSFQGLPMWLEECDQHSLNAAVPRILVGNKCDLTGQVQVCYIYGI